MELDPARTRLLALVAERETDLAAVSRAIGKNHAYLQQFIKRGTPRNLPEDVREALARHFGADTDPDQFRGDQPGGAAQKSPLERELLSSFRVLPRREQEFVIVLCESLVRRLADEPATPLAHRHGRVKGCRASSSW